MVAISAYSLHILHINYEDRNFLRDGDRLVESTRRADPLPHVSSPADLFAKFFGKAYCCSVNDGAQSTSCVIISS